MQPNSRELPFESYDMTEWKKKSCISNVFNYLLALTVILVVVWFLYKILQGGYHLLTSGSDTVKLVIGGTVTIVVAIISSSLAKYLEHNNSIKADLRSQKTPVYREFIEFTLKTVLINIKEGKDNKSEAVSFFQDFTPRLTLWASDDVLKSYLNFKNFSTIKSQDNNNNILLKFEKVVYAMRKDLGYKNKKLMPGDILKMFITDPESIQTLLDAEKSKR